MANLTLQTVALDQVGHRADPELRSAYGVTPLMVAAGLTQTDSRMVAMDSLLLRDNCRAANR